MREKPGRSQPCPGRFAIYSPQILRKCRLTTVSFHVTLVILDSLLDKSARESILAGQYPVERRTSFEDRPPTAGLMRVERVTHAASNSGSWARARPGGFQRQSLWSIKVKLCRCHKGSETNIILFYKAKRTRQPGPFSVSHRTASFRRFDEILFCLLLQPF